MSTGSLGVSLPSRVPSSPSPTASRGPCSPPATMAHVPVRPLPTALQTHERAQRQSRVSFTSGGSSPHLSGGSSLQFVASTASSQSSSAPPVPLPKGARPPSPQPSSAHHSFRHERIYEPRKSSASSTWKLEWRGISKMVKWAFLGDKVCERRKPTQSVGPSSWTRRNSSAVHNTRGPRPYDLRTSRVDIDLTMSPENSDSRVDLVYEAERRVAQSEMGHAVDYSSCDFDHASAPYPFAQHDGPYPALGEHASHVRSRSSPNVHYARTGRGQPKYVSPGESQWSVSEVGHAALLHNSIPSSTVPRHTLAPSSRSDIGHGSAAMSDVHPSGMASTLFLHSGQHGVPFPAHSGRGSWSPSAFQDLQSSVTLPMNTGQHDVYKLTDRRNPRKLRKSIKTSTTQSDLGHGVSLTSLTVHTNSSNNKAFVNLQNTTPPSSRTPMTVTQPPRPPRKLSKKPSPQLPPIPNSRQPSIMDEPPPVPPKPRLTRRSMNLPLPPLPPPPSPPSLPTDSSDSSVPSSTNTSHSSTLVDETSENVHELDRSQLSTTSGRAERPPFLRTESNRRWTVAVADVPDDLFIEEFDRLRRMGLRVNEVMGINQKLSQQSLNVSIKSGGEEHVQVQVHNAGHTALVDQCKKRSSTVVEVHIATEDEMEWTHARRAIMCCRELVRTERSYQARLQELFEGQVSDSVPKLLHQYLPALITASKVLSSHFNEDMSTTGVSRAIIQSEPVLEDAFLAWSSVVGEFFGGKREASFSPRHKRGITIAEHVATTEYHTVHEIGEELYRSKSKQTNEEVYVAPAVESTEGRPRRAMSTHWLLRPAFSQSPYDEDGSGVHFLSLRKSFKRSSGTGDDKKKRKPPFRELAILPTQRVTRYALLFKDLLKHTPLTSNSHEIVEKAVRCAESLARKCDQAQGNTAFY